jgi:DNA-binding Lrp family transcriptional regulator
MTIQDSSITERILTSLNNRQNPSIRGIAEKIGVSSSWLRKKIMKLRKEGIIQSWKLILNPMAYQGQQIFFFLLKTNPNEPEVVNKLLDSYDLKKLSLLEGISGEYSLIGRFHFPNASDFLASLDHLYHLVGETGFQKYRLIEVIRVYKEHGIPSPSVDVKLKKNERERLEKIQQLGKETELPPSTYQIAQLLDVTQPVIYRQIKKWKNNRIILGYSLTSSYWSQNYIHSYIQIKAPLGKYKTAIDFCIQDESVIDVYRTNQEYSLLVKARHLNLMRLNNFLKTFYRQVEVEDTLTRIVLDDLRS